MLTSDTAVFQWYIEFTVINDLFRMVSNLLSYVTGQISMPLDFSFFLSFFLSGICLFFSRVRFSSNGNFRVINLINIRSAKEFHFNIHVI